MSGSENPKSTYSELNEAILQDLKEEVEELLAEDERDNKCVLAGGETPVLQIIIRDPEEKGHLAGIRIWASTALCEITIARVMTHTDVDGEVATTFVTGNLERRYSLNDPNCFSNIIEIVKLAINQTHDFATGRWR